MAFRSKLARQNQCCGQVMPAPVIPICAISCTPPTPICKIETPIVPPYPPCVPFPPCPEPPTCEEPPECEGCISCLSEAAQAAQIAQNNQIAQLTQAIHELIASKK